MASNWKRYGEARLYAAGAGIMALVILWSVLVAQDRSAGQEPRPEDGPAQRAELPQARTQTRTGGS